MLGFGKKKKKENKETSQENLSENQKNEKSGDEPDAKDESPDKESEKKAGKKKKKLSIKLIFIVLLVLVCIGVSSYLIYTLYFAQKSSGSGKANYEKIILNHVNLPEEMLLFSFEYFPDLYAAMIVYNAEMDLFDQEIARIESIAQKYPDQEKIANKEKKTWEKAKNTLQKSFLKIEKPVKATYVLFQVNKEQGLDQIQNKTNELNELAQTALTRAQELTQKLNTDEKIPEGFIKSTIYKLKKKFL